MQHPALAVGMDIGGTKIEGSLVDREGKIYKTLRRPALTENQAMLDRITEMVEELTQAHEVVGVGFSIPGSIDPSTGLLRNAPNSPAILGTPFGEDLRARLDHQLSFENDANCLTLSEQAFGAARGYRHVVGIILGTGVGGGVMLDGKMLHGAHGIAGEPGHMPLKVDGRRCLCGSSGCAEAYLSGPSLLRRYHDAGGESGVSDTRQLFERTEDTIARNIIEETRHLFARFLAALVSLYDPEVFVLGGGLSLQPMFYQQEALIAQYSFGTESAVPVLPAQGGDASGKLGAAALAFQRAS